MRLSLLHRYVLKEYLVPFVVGLLVFTFLLVLHHLFLMMDLFLNRGVDLLIILRMVFFIFLMSLPLSLPMASLLAALISYGRLSEEGELTALRSAGCTLAQYASPSIIFALFISFFLVFFNLSLAPRATLEFKNIHYLVAQKNPLALFAPKVMNHFGEYKVIVEKMDRRKKQLTGISIYKMNPTGSPTRILAPRGELNSVPGDGVTLELFDGTIHHPNAEKDNEYTITKFNRFALRIPVRTETAKRSYTPREMTYRQLKAKIKESIVKNLDPAPLRSEVNLRIAIAFAPLIFGLLGTVLGIRLKKGSQAVGFGARILVGDPVGFIL